MSEAFTQFEQRLDSLERKHRELANGYVAKINPDGLITVEPKSAQKGSRLRLLVWVLVACISFKVIAVTIVGQPVYQTRVDVLNAGTAFEKACAWIMQLDPLTLQLARIIQSLFG